MQKLCLCAGMLSLVLTGCSTVSNIQSSQKPISSNVDQGLETTEISALKRDPNCKVDETIPRNTIPQTPNNMSLPSFGQGIIGWATGPEGAQARLESVKRSDISNFKAKGVTLEMVEEWQAFYDNEVKRNPCNPTAPYRGELMKKIATLWMQ